MTVGLFVTDLHGNRRHYRELFSLMRARRPAAVFIGGDILPPGQLITKSLDFTHQDFINGFLVDNFVQVKAELGDDYPRVFIILGNDDGRLVEPAMLDAAVKGVWDYAHDRKINFRSWNIYGYSYVPPTPFLLKDWEKYDVSRYVDPGCISPEEGWRLVPVAEHEKKFSTIKQDLARLIGKRERSDAGEALQSGAGSMARAIFLFHAPPYRTNLDRAALDGKTVEGAPVDSHVGSIAIKEFIEEYQPLVTLHGHVHESSRLTKSWRDRIGRTILFNGAYDGPELAVIQFNLENPSAASRELI